MLGRTRQRRSPLPGLDRAGSWLAGQVASDAAATRKADALRPDLLAQAVGRHIPVSTPAGVAQAMEAVAEDLFGLGPLARYARTPGITDLLVTDGQLWLDGSQGLRRTELRLEDDQVRALALRLITQGGKRLDEGQPFADVFTGGYRVHAVIPPVVARPQLSIRVPAQIGAPGTSPGLTELSADWHHREYWLDLLGYLIQGRMNVLLSGATGAGKTTLMTALLATASARERIITIEDTPELAIDHPHVVSLRTREATAEGTGEISMAELIRQALRMRPDRLIVGECRGGELADFLSAMNTGHTGALGTIHANSLTDVPARLSALGSLARLTPLQLGLQVRSAIHVFIHVARTRDGVRQPVQAGVLAQDSEQLHIQLAVDTGTNGHLVAGPGMPVLQKLVATVAASQRNRQQHNKELGGQAA